MQRRRSSRPPPQSAGSRPPSSPRVPGLRRGRGRRSPSVRLPLLAGRTPAGAGCGPVARPVQLPAARRSADDPGRLALRDPVLAARCPLRAGRCLERPPARRNRACRACDVRMAPRPCALALGGWPRGARFRDRSVQAGAELGPHPRVDRAVPPPLRCGPSSAHVEPDHRLARAPGSRSPRSRS